MICQITNGNLIYWVHAHLHRQCIRSVTSKGHISECNVSWGKSQLVWLKLNKHLIIVTICKFHFDHHPIYSHPSIQSAHRPILAYQRASLDKWSGQMLSHEARSCNADSLTLYTGQFCQSDGAPVTIWLLSICWCSQFLNKIRKQYFFWLLRLLKLLESLWVLLG